MVGNRRKQTAAHTCRLRTAPQHTVTFSSQHRRHSHRATWKLTAPNQNSSAKYRHPELGAGAHRQVRVGTVGVSHRCMRMYRPDAACSSAWSGCETFLLAVNTWTEKWEVAISKTPGFFPLFPFFWETLVSNSAKESKCWTKINCTWSSLTRQLVSSPCTEAIQCTQTGNQEEEGMPGSSSCWIYQLERVHCGWPTQLCSSGKGAKERHKGQYHSPGWKFKTHAKLIAVLLLFSKVQVVSTEA